MASLGGSAELLCRAAFSRLVAAMERWIAEGFWYYQGFVRDWTSHPNFPRPYGESYYEVAYKRLSDLAYWMFMGESPYEGDGPLQPL
jgi:hypothetical protein